MKRFLTTLAGLACAAPAFGIINFETGSDIVGGGSFNPSDNDDISSIIFKDGDAEIQFLFSSGSPTVEDANTGESLTGADEGSGSDRFGFVTSNDGNSSNDLTDTEAAGFTGVGMDDFFLRGDALSDFGILTINYVNGTSSKGLGFQIWDIDGGNAGTEKYTVTFFNDNNAPGSEEIGSVTTPEGTDVDPLTSLDGLPFDVQFTATGADVITRVEVDFTGTKTNNIGLALDNFNAEGIVIPEPSALGALFGFTALAFAATRRSRRA